VLAVADLAEKRRPLPTPLPPAPGIPYEYLMQISIALDAAELPGRVQLQILTQLKQALRDEEDEAARHDVRELLRRLRRHPEITFRIAMDIDELLMDTAASTSPTVEPVPSNVLEDVIPPRSTGEESLSREPAPEPETSPATLTGQICPKELHTPWWSFTALALGIIGLAQLGPLAFYDISFIFDIDPTAPGFEFRSRKFLTTFAVLAFGCGAGVAAALGAIRLKQRWAYASLATSLAGLLVVLAVLRHYTSAEFQCCPAASESLATAIISASYRRWPLLKNTSIQHRIVLPPFQSSSNHGVKHPAHEPGFERREGRATL
jgi:hypothetical protein